MDQFEELMNKLTDMDWGWWPFLSIRPPKNKDIDNQILLKMALAFGSLIGIICWLADVAMSARISVSHAIYFFVAGWVFFFVLYKFSFAIFWNRRARRLRGDC